MVQIQGTELDVGISLFFLRLKENTITNMSTVPAILYCTHYAPAVPQRRLLAIAQGAFLLW